MLRRVVLNCSVLLLASVVVGAQPVEHEQVRRSIMEFLEAFENGDLEAIKPGLPFWPWYGDSIHPRRPEYRVFSR